MSIDDRPDLFHCCAAWAYFEAMAEGKEGDSEFVRKRAYQLYEQELRNN